MPDLAQSLRDHDYGYLKIVADFWAVPLEGGDAREAALILARRLLNRDAVQEMLEVLPPEASQVLGEVIVMGGRVPWALFTRSHGTIREVGPGKRDREAPHLAPVSPVEVLWYRALIARAFFEGDGGPEEFAYIPADLLGLLEPPDTPATDRRQGPLGRAAAPEEVVVVRPATDHILDHACTLLAARRLGLQPGTFSAGWAISETVLTALLNAAGLFMEGDQPDPEETKKFLEAGRGDALVRLVAAWLGSEAFDELALVAHLEKEGEWQGSPLRARRAVWEEIQRIPDGQWWNLDAFVEGFKAVRPDFQRPSGDYDSWYLRDGRTGDYLRGFEHWDAVDGALIRFVVSGPLHWLGLLDLAQATETGVSASFRWSAWAAALRQGRPPKGLAGEDAQLQVLSDGRLVVPRLVPRRVRYQLARSSAWSTSWPVEAEESYQYRLTPGSLEAGRKAGLRVNQLLSLLRRHAERVPPNVGEALARWDEFGVEARMEQATVLRLKTPEMLQKLRGSRAARFLGVPLGPTSIIVKPGARRQVVTVLAELGIMTDSDDEGQL